MQDITSWEVTLMATDIPESSENVLSLAPLMRFGDNINTDYGIYNNAVSLYRYDSNNPQQVANWGVYNEYVISWSDLESARNDIRVLNSPNRQSGYYKTMLTWSIEIVP